MRTLTPAADAAANATTAMPLLLLKLVLPGGIHWFAERELTTPVVAQGRIASLSPVQTALDESRGGGDATLTVTLRDEDRALLALLDAEEFAQAEATLYQHFDTLGESDMVPLLGGIVAAPPHWQEEANTLTLTIRGLEAMLAERMLGRFADRLTFPDVAPEDEGALLPLVYGKPQRVKAVLVEAGARSELALPLGYHESTLLVQDAARFPSGTIRLRIEQEILEGSFTGNLFTITTRPWGEAGGSFGAVSGNPSIVHTDLAGADNAYTGRMIQATVAGSEQTRLISASTGGTLYLSMPFTDAEGYAHPTPGGAFSFASQRTAHPAGTRVYHMDGDWLYLLNDAPSAHVAQIEGRGRVETLREIGDTPVVSARDGYTPLPRALYTIDTNDTTSLPSLGRPVTTLRLPLPPGAWPEDVFIGDEIWATLEGVPDSGSVALENPANVIEHLLVEVAGLDPARIDATSFAEAGTARSDHAFAFALPRAMAVAEAAQSLAFQARLALLWESGVAKLRVLSHAQPSPMLTLGTDAIALESIELTGEDRDVPVSEILGRYRRAGEATGVRVRDEATAAAWGTHEEAIDFWAFQSRHEVFLASHWWLARWNRRWREVTVRTYLPGLALERLDGVRIDHPLLPGGSATGSVRRIEHRPGNPNAGEIDTLAVTLRMPYAAGCASNCETSCETTACESGSCELSCTAANETGCVYACESSRQAGGSAGSTGTSSHCYSTCQLACRASGESYSPDCGSNCETGCEITCEGMAFETACTTGCESSVEVFTLTRDIIQVEILSATTAAYGNATVIEASDGGQVGESFSAHDAFDLHYPAGSLCAAILTRSGTWVLSPGERNVKYVKVTGGSDPSYTVTEQDAAGTTWGSSFSATAVDAT